MARNESSSNSNALYLQPFAGRIAAKSKEPREGFQLKTYTNISTGATMTAYVKTYQNISGIIRRVQYREGENEGQKIQSWKILLEDSEGIISFEFGAATNVARTWMRTTPNIDLSKEVELTCFPDKENEKKTVLIVKQNGAALKFAYTKENPNGMPPPKLRATGKWDFGDTEEWLHERNLEFADKVSKANPNFGQSQEIESYDTPQHTALEENAAASEKPSFAVNQIYRNREGITLTITGFNGLTKTVSFAASTGKKSEYTVEQWNKGIAPSFVLQEPVKKIETVPSVFHEGSDSFPTLADAPNDNGDGGLDLSF